MDYICDRCGVNESNYMSICESCKTQLKYQNLINQADEILKELEDQK